VIIKKILQKSYDNIGRSYEKFMKNLRQHYRYLTKT